MDHDGWYKRLFSHRQLVADLLTGFVPGSWVEELDLATLAPVASSFVGDKLERRESDAIWRFDQRRDGLRVYLLLEFQSTVDPTMASRMLSYVALLHQQLDKESQTAGGPLPPVLPVVLYNGEARWTAAREITERIAPAPPELVRHQPRLLYLLIDELRRAADPVPRDNLAAAVFRCEASRGSDDVDRVLANVAPRLAGRESLTRALLDWLAFDLLPNRDPRADFGRPKTVKEMRAMLQQNRRRTWEEMAEEEGRRQGEALVLERLLTLKFGPLSEKVLNRLSEAAEDDLLRWNERCLSAGSLDEVFG